MMMIEKIKSVLINFNASIIEAIKVMDSCKRKLLVVIDDSEKFVGLVSIGDIQRAIISNIDIATAIKEILRDSIKVSYIGYDKDKLFATMIENRREFEPILDGDNNIVDIVFWEDVTSKKHTTNTKKINLPVVIMAGGKGSRLRPLTNVLPKPLIPIGEQTMMEDIMDRFVDCGCDKFYVSVNYKAEVIKSYFDSLSSKRYNMEFFQEEKPLGTAGSLHLVKDVINSSFFVSNCDIIIDEDYSQILNYHKDHKNEITIVAALKTYSIPYGTLETLETGRLGSLKEKPNMVFKINTGMYILEPHLLEEIPINNFFNITDLIDKLCIEKRNVGVFPISEGSWTDIGNWQEYMNKVK